jgi:hypothetical protein
VSHATGGTAASIPHVVRCGAPLDPGKLPEVVRQFESVMAAV